MLRFGYVLEGATGGVTAWYVVGGEGEIEGLALDLRRRFPRNIFNPHTLFILLLCKQKVKDAFSGQPQELSLYSW